MGKKKHKKSQSWKLYNKHANTQNETDENSRYPIELPKSPISNYNNILEKRSTETTEMS
jgi:hypothetical protein